MLGEFKKSIMSYWENGWQTSQEILNNWLSIKAFIDIV
jgi:hypothetical protein